MQKMKTFTLLLPCALAFMLMNPARVAANDSVLIHGPEGVVTVADVLAEARRHLPPEEHAGVLLRADNVRQIALGLYVRRALSARAERDGIADEDDLRADLRILRERALSTALLERSATAALPSARIIEAQARATWLASNERFGTPERIHARHILIATRHEDARERAERVLAEARAAGADFAALAAEYSDDPGSAARGGDLGAFARGRMVEPFERAVFAATTAGVLDELVETDFGFHIVEVLDFLPAGRQPFEEVRETLVSELRNKFLQDAVRKIATEIEADAGTRDAAIAEFAARFRAAE